jgi:hypothetical protein
VAGKGGREKMAAKYVREKIAGKINEQRLS